MQVNRVHRVSVSSLLLPLHAACTGFLARDRLTIPSVFPRQSPCHRFSSYFFSNVFFVLQKIDKSVVDVAVTNDAQPVTVRDVGLNEKVDLFLPIERNRWLQKS